MRESRVEAAVNAWAARAGIIHLKMRPHVTGYPDDVYLYEGRACFIEFKRPKSKGEHAAGVLAPIQVYRINELRTAGFKVEVIDDASIGIAFLETAILSRGGGH